MKILPLLLAILFTSTFVNAQTPAPDDVVTKGDIKDCLKHLRKTENFLYPQSLKVESAHYFIQNEKILLTLSLSQTNEYGGATDIQEKQCELDTI